MQLRAAGENGMAQHPDIVLDPGKHDLSSKGHLTQKLFLLFSVFFHENKQILMFSCASSMIDPPYYTYCKYYVGLNRVEPVYNSYNSIKSC
jgi:hypothetical protein